MRNHPIVMETSDNTLLTIVRCHKGKFWIEADPLMMYDIREETFYQLVEGEKRQLDIYPKNPKSLKTWLKAKK